MRKALAHIFFLCVLLSTGLANAMVVPHDVMAATSVHQENKSTITDYQGSSIFSKDITLNDWDECDESDFDDTSSKKATVVTCPAKDSCLAARHTFQSSKVEVYTDLNFSRLPRYNYITLRVLRI